MTKQKWIILGIVLCCAYIISPLDILPEMFIGPFGFIDDAAVLALMVSLIKKLWGLQVDCQPEQKEMKQAVVEMDESPSKVDPPKLNGES